jgi:hypothetical protein
VSVAILLVTGVMTFLGGRIAGTHISPGLLAADVIGVDPLAQFFGGVSALGCGAMRSSRTVNGIAVGTLVAMYALDLAGRLTSTLDGLRYVSAFRYYGSPILDGIDTVSFIGLASAGLLLALLGALLLERRDIRRSSPAPRPPHNPNRPELACHSPRQIRAGPQHRTRDRDAGRRRQRGRRGPPQGGVNSRSLWSRWLLRMTRWCRCVLPRPRSGSTRQRSCAGRDGRHQQSGGHGRPRGSTG